MPVVQPRIRQGYFFTFAALFSIQLLPMIKFSRLILDNGLRVVVYPNRHTPLVAVQVMYHVGSRDEDPEKTGLAHLFEHLMFSGSENVPDFDTPSQLAGGENNAYTNQDVTCYFHVLPADNLEVALWLESDRMGGLKISQEQFELQRKVVIEEFKETVLQEPYGDVLHHMCELAYQVHPYRWPVIGKDLEHLQRLTLEDVLAFYRRFYRPNNAVLVIAGNVHPARAKALAKKYFSDIPPGDPVVRQFPVEPAQREFRSKTIERPSIPVDALYLVFHMCGRFDPGYYAAELLTDLLSSGPSSRLFAKLFKEHKLVNSVDCYLTGTEDPGLVVVEAKPAEGVSLQQAEEAIWEELTNMQLEPPSVREMKKLKNQIESSLRFRGNEPREPVPCAGHLRNGRKCRPHR
ncbi:MAG: zinc protease [Saprospiraceae bacterium]|nr:MAG: zinc protease [Saprospiraceae bacterium]